MNFNLYFLIDIFFILTIIDSNRNVNHVIQRIRSFHRNYRIFNFII